jgi:hypothetical protein
MAKVTITGTDFGDIAPEIQEALDKALSRTLNLQQGALSKSNPKDTSRMAASWHIGKNSPDLSVAPENPGSAEPKPYNGKITFEGDWYISNNLPYSTIIALNYSAAVMKAQKDWFTSIANQTGVVFANQFKKVAP